MAFAHREDPTRDQAVRQAMHDVSGHRVRRVDQPEDLAIPLVIKDL
jgi:hypothetical protein